ncbi:matrix metalloproteinase-2-like isoform X2 [Ornithodoros turicata]|uniref:matrix metalloproteinase-2-like isoform X2 n=1 Tax=Ornithodoros turicata TaxID=34597 RepID=UPI00313980DD
MARRIIRAVFTLLLCRNALQMPAHMRNKMEDYLSKYGYLGGTGLPGDTGPSSDSLRTEEGFRDALKRMQHFAGLRPTGRLDDETMKLMKARRCGLPDMAGHSERVRRYALQGAKWDKTDLTYSVANFPRGVDHHMIRKEVGRALRVWSDNSKLSFTELPSRSKSDIVIAFERLVHGDGYPFDGPGTILGHAFFPGPDRGGDAHFDADENWVAGAVERDSDGVSLFAVAAHEFGHSLGLSHSSVPGSLMFPYYQGDKEELKLPYDDLMGIQRLYGSKNNNRWVTMHPIIPRTTTRRPGHRGQVPQRRPQGNVPSQRPYDGPRREPSTHDSYPDKCDTSIDAISVIRREMFAFKGKYFWRVNERGPNPDRAVLIRQFWHLGDNVEKIDAAYERPDRKIAFFSGRRYWLLDATNPLRGYPRPLTDLGLPSTLSHIDAAMVWGHNGKTYFFSGDQYWRYDEQENSVEPDYPRHIRMWKGVPRDIDAAFQWTDGQTYFFKGRNFWRFNDRLMSVYNQTNDIGQVWFNCPLVRRSYADGHRSGGMQWLSLPLSVLVSTATFVFMMRRW